MVAVRTPFPRVLVPYDGSEPARAALRLAITLARGGSQLRILTVIDEASTADSGATLAEAAAQCRSAGVEPQVGGAYGRPVPAILAACEAHACNMIVMGTHGRRGPVRMLLGSVTDGVLRSAPVPVLTVRTVDDTTRSPFTCAVVAIDDSEAADAILSIAAILSLDERTSLIAFHAVDTRPIYLDSDSFGPNIDELVGGLLENGRMGVERAFSRAALPETPAIEVVDGDPVPSVIESAHRNHATIVIAGRHGGHGFRRFFLGNVTDSLVRTSDIPVLVVPPIRTPA
jgi:nucleotide-binding universal stress UspA family protein